MDQSEPTASIDASVVGEREAELDAGDRIRAAASSGASPGAGADAPAVDAGGAHRAAPVDDGAPSSGDNGKEQTTDAAAGGDGGRPDGGVEAQDAATVTDPDAPCPVEFAGLDGQPCSFDPARICEYGMCVLDWSGELRCVDGTWQMKIMGCF